MRGGVAAVWAVGTSGATFAGSEQLATEPVIERQGAPHVAEVFVPGQDQEARSPLSFRIGAAEFTPGGFMDFTAIFRSTNTGNSGGTNFGSIPFSNTVAGHLSETRFTAANSRLSLKATSRFGDFSVTGYVEADFLGNDAANVFVTSDSHTFRMRLYYADIMYNRWEILAGQAWSWLTPNRVGLSSEPSKVFYTVNEDFNYQVGLTWARQLAGRLIYHPSDNWAFGIGVENSEQFVGIGEVTFPFALNAQLGTQFDAGNNPGTPNVLPDFIAKGAYDRDAWGRHFHAEAVGLLSVFRDTNTVANGSFVHHDAVGGGVSVAANGELFPGFRLLANYFHSVGGSRYIFGLGPDVVIHPDGGISTVKSDSGIAGFEWQALPTTLLAGYYGQAYFHRNAFIDSTSPLAVQPFIGLGGANSPNSANQRISEFTGDWIQTFWANPQYGAVQTIVQYSYLQRDPFFAAAGTPTNANTHMLWFSLRYLLP